MNTAHFLRHAAQAHPTSPAIRCGSRCLTYAELDRQAAAFGSAMLTRGLQPGDRVALLMRNCPEYVVSMFGAWRAGLAIVPLNAKLIGREIAAILDDSGAQALILGADKQAVLGDWDAGALAACVLVGDGDDEFVELLASSEPLLPVAEVDPDQLAWLFYTSGTTGRSKGAKLSHRNLTAMTVAELANLCDYRPDDRVLHVAPLSHGSGLYLLGVVARGAENIIFAGGSYDPARVLELIEAERVTAICFMAPTMIAMLLDARPETDTGSLRRVVYGGAPIHLQHSRRMLERFGPIFAQMYGLGEAPMTITYWPAERHDPADEASLTCAGHRQLGVEVEVKDEAGAVLSPGEEGEICVRGDVVMAGYWGNPEATADALRDGWLHTGDIGRFDEHGRLFLLDRSNDTIISGGTNIYPREVEDALLAHAAVNDVVVFGLPDELWGDSVAAAVVAAPGSGLTADELVEHCRSRLAGFKKPKQVFFVDELPKNAYGKVMRRVVRGHALEGIGSPNAPD